MLRSIGVELDWLLLAGAVVFLGLTVLSMVRPDLAWVKVRPDLSPERRVKLIRRRQIGTVFYFAIGAIFLVLSTR